jgi:hypothetical protein
MIKKILDGSDSPWPASMHSKLVFFQRAAPR